MLQVPATVLVRVTHPIFHVAAVPAAQPSALASGLRDSEPPGVPEGVASPKNFTPAAPPAKLGSLQASIHISINDRSVAVYPPEASDTL